MIGVLVEIFIPPTFRQARWLVVGGLFALVLGALRVATFFRGGGLMFLILGVLFAALGILSVAAAVIRFRRGDQHAGSRGAAASDDQR